MEYYLENMQLLLDRFIVNFPDNPCSMEKRCMKYVRILFCFSVLAFLSCPMNISEQDKNEPLEGEVTLTIVKPNEDKAVDVQVGYKVYADTSKLTGSGDLSYQWFRGASPINTEVGEYYTVQQTAIGQRIAVRVRRSDKEGEVRSTPSDVVTNPDNTALTGSVSITDGDNAKVGTALFVNTNMLGGEGTINYTWYRGSKILGGGVTIGGQNSYTPVDADVGFALTVSVSRPGFYAGTITDTTALVKANLGAPPVQPSPPTPPSGGGETVQQGGSDKAVIRGDLADVTVQQYTATNALVVRADGGQVSYQWYKAPNKTGTGTAIAGKTSASFTPSTDAIGTSYYYVHITNVNWWPEGLTPTTIRSKVAQVTVTQNTEGSGIGSTDTTPDKVVQRFQSYLSRANFEAAFPLRLGSSGWKKYMQDNRGHTAFPEGKWQTYSEYYSYDNLIAAIREIAAWGYVLETRNVPGGLTNYNSRGYIVNKTSGKTFPVFEEDGFNAEWNAAKPIIKTIVDYGSFINSAITNDNKRELSAFLANIAHETGAGWEGAPGGEEAWGLFYNEEVAVVTSGGYSDSYTSHESTEYPPVKGQSYHGRGGIQISWNYNYGPFSILAFGNKDELLKNPGKVAKEGKLGWMSALWFWMTPQLPKASCHDVIQSTWKPEGIFASGTSKGITWGFGATINIINGGFEAGGRQKQRRINHYRDLTNKTGANIQGEKLDTTGMSPWT